MPAPLLMPVKRDHRGRRCAVVSDAAFGWVSVVMMPSAALNQLSAFRFAMAAGRPATTLRQRQRFQDHAGRKRQAPAGRRCRAGARLPSQVARAFARPCLAGAGVGVAGIDDQRADRFAAGGLTAARLAWLTWTGAAQKRFLVNTPATVAPSASFITSTVLAVRLLDAGFGITEFDPVDGFQFARDGQWGIDGHGMSNTKEEGLSSPLLYRQRPRREAIGRTAHRCVNDFLSPVLNNRKHYDATRAPRRRRAGRAGRV